MTPPGRVRVLPEDVKNQIAAGEVVERPASVVKELLENALDAGAHRIKVEVLGGGIDLLRVEDDGHGMAPEDARLALVRHATSKLRDTRDLERMATLGFRGEALPAMASVSRFVLRTSTEGAQEGFELRVEGGGPAEEGIAPAVPGTSIEVSDLFYNVPARRKFLKRPSTELGHITDVVTRLALARPDVGFKLVAEGRSVVDAPRLEDPADESAVRARLQRLLGRAQAESLVPMASEHLARAIRVEGWLGRPPASERGPRGLHVFVNGRFVRERTLLQAIQEGYRGRLPKGRQPVVVLFLELDPRDVDVNVHPQKTEVRFARPGEVFRAVQSRLRRGLAEMGVEVPDSEEDPTSRRRALALAAERPVPGPGAEVVRDRPAHEPYRGHARRIRQAFATSPAAPEGKRIAQWLEPRPTGDGPPGAPAPLGRGATPGSLPTNEPAPSAPSSGFGGAAQLGLELPRTPLSKARRLGIAMGRWAILEAEGALWLVDLPAARARIALEDPASEPGPAQPLLMPRVLPIPSPERVLAEHGGALAEAGFELSARDGELVLLAAPEGLEGGELDGLVEVAIEASREDRPVAMAVAAEIRRRQSGEGAGGVHEDEVGPILEGLERAAGGAAGAHAPVVVSLSARQLAQLFGSGR